MVRFYFFLFSFSFSILSWSQSISGTWQGVLIPAGKTVQTGSILYFELTEKSRIINGTSRDEIYGATHFADKLLEGERKENKLLISQTVITKKSYSRRITWCRMDFDLQYNDSTGYLSGNYKSSDCRNNMGKVILYQSDGEVPKGKQEEPIQTWVGQFHKDLALGLNAPKIRKLERENFDFQPIYFDYDKSEIRPEHYDFLNRLIRVVQGHSDLRVKVVGHTDADGSNNYNDGLSKRRAEAIIQYFVAKGLRRDRLEFDFKGETQPVDTNDTPEGMQRNRRVDFSFI